MLYVPPRRTSPDIYVPSASRSSYFPRWQGFAFRLHSCSEVMTIMSNDRIVSYAVAPNSGSAIPYSLKKRGTKMPIVHIEHPVPNFVARKKPFDTAPLAKTPSGDPRY